MPLQLSDFRPPEPAELIARWSDGDLEEDEEEEESWDEELDEDWDDLDEDLEGDDLEEEEEIWDEKREAGDDWKSVSRRDTTGELCTARRFFPGAAAGPALGAEIARDVTSVTTVY